MAVLVVPQENVDTPLDGRERGFSASEERVRVKAGNCPSSDGTARLHSDSDLNDSIQLRSQPSQGAKPRPCSRKRASNMPPSPYRASHHTSNSHPTLRQAISASMRSADSMKAGRRETSSRGAAASSYSFC